MATVTIWKWCSRLTPGVSQISSKRSISTSAALQSWFEYDKKGGYETYQDQPFSKSVREGFKMLGPEMRKMREEFLTKIRCDSLMPLAHGDYEVFWRFNSADNVDEWLLTADRDHGEGKSNGELVLSKNKTGIFQGTLCTEVPKDGTLKQAGYCNMRSPKNYQSFRREIPYDWTLYTHLLMKVRGDGRTYQIVLAMERYFDIQWNDQYQYALFTRGGPYWQVAKIPLSKFFLVSKGRVQDKQCAMDKANISHMGITIADDKNGPFALEIDYIALIYDHTHTEEFAYEMYPTPAWKMY